jgi:hypothetical protein
MSNDGYIADDIWFAACLMYLFGEQSLTKIEVSKSPEFHRHCREVKLHLDIPSLDAQEYYKEFKAGALAISDLKSYIRTYTWITRILRDMERKTESVWVSPAWVAGRGR